MLLAADPVNGVSGPDLALHLLHAQPGLLGGLYFIVADAEHPQTHVKDAIEAEEDDDHD